MVNLSDLMALLWSQFWQVTLVAACVALLVRYLVKNRPYVAHTLWLLVLLKCLTPPVWSCTSGIFCWLQTPQHATHSTIEISRESPLLDIQDPYADADVVVHVPRQEDSSNHPAGINDAETRARSTHSQTPATGWQWRTVSYIALLTAWLTGTLVFVAAGLWRLWNYWNMLRRSNVIEDAEVAALVARLCKQLRLGGRVRLLITDSPVGPAVLGVFRPLVVLPLAVVQNKSPAQLEPILAHELLHIRRGDLWVSLLQSIAQAVWWFHPLVWLASKLISREAERCCDEQVLAELSCPPAVYARSLVDVLDLKRTLYAVSTFPGVRPVEITSKRLERIMQLGQGCRKHTPWWCWMLLFVLAGAALPGGAFQATADENSAPAKVDQTTHERPQQDAGKQPNFADMPQHVLVYKVDDLLKRIGDEYHVKRERARQLLSGWLKRAPQNLEMPAAQASVRWSGGSLVIYGSPRQHDEIAQSLKQLRKFGLYTIRFETRVAYGSEAEAAEMMRDWESLGAAKNDRIDGTPELTWPSIANDPSLRQIRDQRESVRGEGRQIVERRLPLKSKLLDAEQRIALFRALDQNVKLNLISCPRITLFDRQQAVIADTTQTPFVVGMKQNESGESEQMIDLVKEGFTMRLHPKVVDSGRLHLNCNVELKDIVKVHPTPVRTSQGDSQLVQTPELRVVQFNLHVKLDHTQILAFGGFKRRNRRGQEESMVIVIEAHITPRLKDDTSPPADEANSAHVAPDNENLGSAHPQSWLDLAQARKSRIERALAHQVTVDWSEKPLKDAIQELADTIDLDIVFDDAGLAESGITRKTPVTIELKHSLSAGNVLTLVLEPLQLRHHDVNGVLQITSESRAAGELVVCTYQVADLVMPVSQIVRIPMSGVASNDLTYSPAHVQFDSLSQLITSTVAPTTWQPVGGDGVVTPYPRTLSLVINQREKIHDEIADLLGQLRRLQDLNITVKVRTARVPATSFDWVSRHPQELSSTELVNLLKELDRQSNITTNSSAAIALFNGQGLELEIDKRQIAADAATWLQLRPVVSHDRQAIRLRLAVNSKDALSALAGTESVVVPDGQSIVFDISEAAYIRDAAPPGVAYDPQVQDLLAKSMRRRGTDRTLCILTPEIVVQEAEEELLGIPGK